MTNDTNKVVHDTENLAANFIEALRAHGQTAVTAGIIMLVCGFLAVAAPFMAGISITIMVGLLLLAGGVAQCFLAFKTGVLGKALLVLLIGLLTAITGGFMLTQPVEGLEALTMFLAVYFMVTGFLELIAAMQIKPTQGWGWLLFNGVVTLALGIIIWRQFPVSGTWALGILFGVKLIMSGWWLILIGRGVKNAPAN